MNEVSEKAGGEDETNGISQENGDGDDSTKKKPWQRIKDGGVRKLPKDVLKRRKNFRLKKLIFLSYFFSGLISDVDQQERYLNRQETGRGQVC